MFIAHLPSGYLLAQGFRKTKQRGIVLAAMVGSIFPDMDMLYFYLIDNRQHHHHSYWTHFPSIYLFLLLIVGIWWSIKKGSTAACLSFVFLLGCILHLVLDSLVGDIPWLAPFSMKFYALATVEAVHKPWWLNFLLHWSFAAEVIIIVAAVIVFIKRRREKRQGLL